MQSSNNSHVWIEQFFNLSSSFSLNYVRKKKKILTLLFSVLLLTLVGAGQLSAQQINKDFAIPQMNACGEPETVQLEIEAGATACNSGQLSFFIPAGFEYQAGSLRLNDVVYTGTVTPSATGSTGTKYTVTGLTVPANGKLNIKFDVQALCEGIQEEGESVAIDYEFSGCFGETLVADSEALNVNYAVFQLDIESSSASAGVIGDEITREIKITNTGNGSINSFKLKRTFNGLVDATTLPADWSVDPTDGSVLIYTKPSGVIVNGESITFNETVRITDCENLTTNYLAYYGCTDICVPGQGELDAQLAFDFSIMPRLEITPHTVNKITCLDGSDDVLIWAVKNVGNGVANDINLGLSSNTAGTTTGATKWTTGDPSTSPTWNAMPFTDELEPGEVIYMRATQQHHAPDASANCEDLESSFAFGNATVTGSYMHAHGCAGAAINLSHSLRNTVNFSFAALNLGATEVGNGGSGSDYEGDISLSEFSVDSYGLGTGAFVTLQLELSSNLAFGGDVKLFDNTGALWTNETASGNSVTITIEYGTPLWEADTNLDLSGLRILFPANIDCTDPNADTYYKLSASLTRGLDCDPIGLQCLTTPLRNTCAEGPCALGGLVNGDVTLQRVQYGLQEQTVNGMPHSSLTEMSPASQPLLRSTAFTTNDILEISQQTIVSVTAESPAEGWTTGNMQVTLPTGLTWVAETTSGTLVIKRDGLTTTVTGLPVTISGGVASVEFNATTLSTYTWTGDALPGFTVFENGDELLISLRIRPTSIGTNELKEFDVRSALTSDGVSFRCGGDYSASGYYARGELSFNGSGSANITSCEGADGASVTFNYSLLNNQRNGLFPLEHIQKIFPKNAIFNIGAGLEMTGLKIRVLGQGSYGGTNERTMSFGTALTGNQTVNVESEIIALQAGSYPRTYLDEGFRIQLIPIVRSTCDAGTTGTVSVQMTFDGTVRDMNQNENADRINVTDATTRTQTLTYNTGKGSLVAASSQPAVLVSGKSASWIIQINNSSTFRTMEGVWFSKSSGEINIASVEQVSGYNDTGAGTPITAVGGDYEVGNLIPGQSKYYRITAKEPLPNCNTATLNLEYGQTCGTRCKEGDVEALTYTMGTPKIQARIIYETQPSNRPVICAEFPYAVEINNAGTALAQDVVIVIPLTSNAHLKYVPGSLRVTDVYSGQSTIANPGGEADIITDFENPSNWTWGGNTGFTTLDDNLVSIVETASSITITIPAGSLPNELGAGQKINVGFMLAANGCDFRSGQRVRFIVRANNTCGNAIPSALATSARVTLKNAPADTSPEMNKVSNAAAIATHNPPGPLYANYNVTFTNTTSNPHPLIGGPAPITSAADGPDQRHRISIKLPKDWVFDGDPEALFPTSVAKYVEYDEAVRGYIFVLTSNVPAGESISLVNKQLRYTGGNPAALDCSTLTINESIFTLFDPLLGLDEIDCDLDFVACWSDHVVFEGSTSLLMVPTPPTAEPAGQVFCASQNPTVADLIATGDNLRFYTAQTGGTALPLHQALTVSVNNNTNKYWVSSSLVPNGACESARVPIDIYIPIANIISGENQAVVNATSFTVTANEAQAPATGEWTVVSWTNATLDQISIVSPSSPTTEIRLPIGAEVVVRWTLKNGDCVSTAETTLRSLIRPIEARNDDYSSTEAYYVNGKTGTSPSPLPGVVLNTPNGSGDTLGGEQAVIGTSTNINDHHVRLIPGTPNSPNLLMDSNTGFITVAPGTPAGIYQYPYTICEVVNPTNCDEAVATIRVIAAPIVAEDDTPPSIDGGTGGRTPSVFENDRLNNNPIVHSEIVLTAGNTPHSGLTMNPDGSVTVSPNTPSGTYEYPYTICEVLNPTNCDDAIATIVVTPPTIVAEDNLYDPVDGVTGSPYLGNILDNDRIGSKQTTTENVNITVTDPADQINGGPVPSVNISTGVVSVPPGTPAGTYEIGYRICDIINPANCDDAIVTVVVPIPPIEASDNTYGPVKGHEGNTNVGNVIPNDLYNGRVPTIEDIDITIVTPATPINGSTNVPSIDPTTGQVSVPAGTPDGTYTIVYEICDVLNPANCDQATVTVTVGDSNIDALDDIYPPVNGRDGGTTGSVLENDLLNGTILNPADVDLIPGASPHTGLTMNPDGTITIAPGTPAGVYQYPYTICETLNTPTAGNCDSAIATVIVTAPPIEATNDTYGPINGTTGDPNVGNILGNDTLNEDPIAGAMVPSEVIISEIHPANPVRPGTLVPVLNTETGDVSVPAGTPEGTYLITYRICEVLNPTNCDDAIITVTVNAPEILAVDNDYSATPINGKDGGNLPTVLGNDELNGAAVVPSEIKLTPGTSPHPGVVMNADGTITVSANTPAGTYIYPYTICEVLNPSNCDDAVATILVEPAPITAENDTPPSIDGHTGGRTPSVLVNDELNGSPVSTSDIRLQPGTPSDPRLVMYPDGTIQVSPGTPAGTYTYPYTICELANPSNCDDAVATIVVTETAILANPDTYGPINGATGSPEVGNALTNDRLNGQPFSLSEVILSVTTAASPVAGAVNSNVPVLDPATGRVSVPAGTPAGTYTIEYSICEVLNASNCATTTVTVEVVEAPIVANDNTYGPVRGDLGNTNLGNIFGNDRLNGLVPSLNEVSLTVTPATPVTPGALVPVVDETTGQVSVPVGTPDGTYTIPYTICELLNPANCDDAIVTVTVGSATIDALDDNNAAEPINGATGGTTRSVLNNDFLNGTILDPTDVVLTPGTSPLDGQITMNANGTITVLPGTPAGSYNYPYTICEVLNPSNCDEAVAIIVVTSSHLDAVNDLHRDINGRDGAVLPTVLENDLLDYRLVNASEVTLTPGNNPLPGKITMDTATGVITVAPGTPAGHYTYPYRICEVLNPNSCDDAEVTIMVVAAPIVAVDDDYSITPINGMDGGTLVPTVLDNDLLNGTAVVRNEITFVPSTRPHANIVMDSNGVITVAPGTKAGTYEYPYQICEVLNPTNCDNAVATIVVEEAPIEAIDDIAPQIDSKTGGITPSVLINDELNGVIVDPNLIKLLPLTASHPQYLTMNVDGTVTVRPETPAGTYTYTYRICEVLNPTNCDDAVITITVTAPAILAVDDDFSARPIKGAEGGTTVTSVLGNDLLNGRVISLSDVVLTPLVASHTGLTMNNNGTITVAPQTPAGTYTYTYRICEVVNPSNCDEATATIVVTAATIDARNDNFLSTPINGKTGGQTPTSVLDNDLLDGKLVVPADVELTPLIASHAGLTMNADGTITVAPSTPLGTYTYTYRICEVLNPTNCDEATATVIVAEPSILAVQDNFTNTPINGKDGGATVSVLDNDLLNGSPVVPSEVTLTPGTSPSAGIQMNPNTGVITVAPETKAGTYIYPYEICEVLNPNNCSSSFATVVVAAPAIEAVNDYPEEINGYAGGTTTLTVLDNDLLNGVILDPNDVKLTSLGSPHPGIVLNTNGTITVAPGTPAGTYPYPYRICEVLNPLNCDIAIAFVKVLSTSIIANDDTPDNINGKTGGRTPSVLDNDTLNGNPVDPNEVKLTPGVPSHPGLTMNPDGTINIAPETPAGTYTYPYTICEVLNQANCDDAVVTITVDAADIEAVDDDFVGDVIYGVDGGTTVGSVLDNDLLNGKLVEAREVTLTPLVASNSALTMNANGTITVAPNTPEGTYTYTYEICEVLNPTNCDEATATVYVLKTSIHAVDDVLDVKNTRTGSISDGSVLTNDHLNNKPLVDGEFTLNPGVPSGSGLTMNDDGTISVAPGTKPGTYTYPYTICEVLNPTNCDDAVAIIRIEAPDLIIPNVFTPNGDNVNDFFEIVGLEEYDYVDLTVINRWGNLIFKNEKYDNKWEGNGVNEGTYFYIITAVKDGHSEVHKGYVTIKRN